MHSFSKHNDIYQRVQGALCHPYISFRSHSVFSNVINTKFEYNNTRATHTVSPQQQHCSRGGEGGLPGGDNVQSSHRDFYICEGFCGDETIKKEIHNIIGV